MGLRPGSTPSPGPPGGHTGPPRGRATCVHLVVPAFCRGGRRLWCEVSVKVRLEAQMPSQELTRRDPDGTGQHCGGGRQHQGVRHRPTSTTGQALATLGKETWRPNPRAQGDVHAQTLMPPAPITPQGREKGVSARPHVLALGESHWLAPSQAAWTQVTQVSSTGRQGGECVPKEPATTCVP